MHSAITAFFEMIKQFFTMRTETISHGMETDIIKDKKLLKKASNITEKIITIVDKYINTFDKKDIRKYNRLKSQFIKYN